MLFFILFIVFQIAVLAEVRPLALLHVANHVTVLNFSSAQMALLVEALSFLTMQQVVFDPLPLNFEHAFVTVNVELITSVNMLN